jgi:hypothetical protein
LTSDSKEERWEDFEPLFYLPNTFKTIEQNIVQTLSKSDYAMLCNVYSMEKEILLNKIERPTIITKDDIDDKFIFDRVAQLRHAALFKDLASNSSAEVKPILMYYSIEQMMNFFSRCLMKFNGIRTNHGITIHYNESIYETKIILEKMGFFARTVDSYSILGFNSVFSALLFRSIPYLGCIDYYENSHSFAIRNSIEITLKDLIENPLNNDIISADLRTIILIYLGSAFARYRPFLWYRIMSGIDNDIILHINRGYDDYNFIFKKIIIALNALRHGDLPYALNSINKPPIDQVYTFNKKI